MGCNKVYETRPNAKEKVLCQTFFQESLWGAGVKPRKQNVILNLILGNILYYSHMTLFDIFSISVVTFLKKVTKNVGRFESPHTPNELGSCTPLTSPCVWYR